MSYTRINWKALPAKTTAISADNLNKMDKGIADAHTEIEALNSSLTTIENSLAKTSGINNILFHFSAKAHSTNGCYYTNSVYIPNNYELEVKTASFLGSVGNFASQITMHKSGNYVCFYSDNSAFAGLTLSVEAQMVESA